MTDEKIKQPEHTCCNIPVSGGNSICKECGNKGKSVRGITLKSLVREPKYEIIKSFDGFYFCETPTVKLFTLIMENRSICIRKILK